MIALRIDRLAIALVRLYRGMWCKLPHAERPRQVITAAPGARLVSRRFVAPLTADQAAWAVRDRALPWGAIEVGDARHCR